MQKEETVAHVYFVFMGACLFGGVLIGAIGLGAGLVFLSPLQALGVGILTFGAGSLRADRKESSHEG